MDINITEASKKRTNILSGNKHLTQSSNQQRAEAPQVEHRTTGTSTTENTQPGQRGVESTTQKDTWGHQLHSKEPLTIWILLQNIGGINMTDSGSIKLVALRNFTKEIQADICAITECNVDWKHAPAYLYPTKQTRYWWESSHWSITHNIQETNKVLYQPRGTAIVVINQAAHWAQ